MHALLNCLKTEGAKDCQKLYLKNNNFKAGGGKSQWWEEQETS